MKKIVAFLCAGAMLLSLAACGSTNGGASAADTNITAGSVVSTDKTGSISSGMGGFGGPGVQMPDGQFPGGDGQRPGSAENGQRPSMPGNGQPPAAPGSGS